MTPNKTNKPKYQKQSSIKLENRFYFNECLVEKLKEKEHHRQKYVALRDYKDSLKQGELYALS